MDEPIIVNETLESCGTKFRMQDYVSNQQGFYSMAGEMYCISQEIYEEAFKSFSDSVLSGDIWDGMNGDEV